MAKSPVRARPKSNSDVLDDESEEVDMNNAGHEELDDELHDDKNVGHNALGHETDNDQRDFEPQSTALSRSEDNSERSAPEVIGFNLESLKEEGVKKTSTKKRKRPPDPNTLSDNDDESDHQPSFLRKTARGGYAHTNKSKLRISRANKGNTPWNKGKNRSSAVKAKIRAGVQARNRVILREKLKVLGMTEDEWNTKKKEIKYLRERLRRAKQANNKFKAAFEEQRLKEALKKTALSNEENKKIKESIGELMQHEGKSSDTRKVKGLEKLEVDPCPKLPAGFSREITWQPLEIDHEEKSEAYGWKCPNGGSGGLICCESCSAVYSKYLRQTSREIETQRASNLGYEVKELLGFLSEAQAKLGIASDAAKQKAPPTTLQASQTSLGSHKPGRKIPTTSNNFEDFDWDVTNTMDIGADPNIAKL